jgi:hypothetical protein
VDNKDRHRNNDVCADNEVFGGIVPLEAFFLFTEDLKAMKPKKTESEPAKAPAKRKPVTTGTKAAPPRSRARKKVVAPTEEGIREMAYALWESRGRPMGSPEADWFEAKEHFASIKAS